MNILQKIFKEHYEEMIYLQHPRDSVIENVDKMINCGNPSFGGAIPYAFSSSSRKNLYKRLQSPEYTVVLLH